MPNIVFLVLRRMRTPLIILIAAYAFAILGFVLIPGQDDAGVPWRMSFFHSFYFVSFMGSTIGFGEIPYPFTDAQRLWTLVTIYTTVISWLFAIGTLIAQLQTPLFRAEIKRSRFERSVRKIKQPFHIVCGYGDTGKLLVKALCDNNSLCVVIDKIDDRVNELSLEELPISVPALNADASDSDSLLDAGLVSPFCNGVIAITRDDQVNLKIAIACKLLNKDIKVYCWAETTDTGANMMSFNTEHVIYPYDTFAEYLSNALSSPNNYLLQQWLSSPRGTLLTDPVFPPKGKWILCGYGRFGKAVHQKLVAHGLDVTIIEEFPETTGSPEGTIEGRGTEAETLQLAGVSEAAGIVAGTDHDVNNLSIILTSRILNTGLFTIARQELATNNAIFNAASIDLVTNHSRLISSRLLSLITTPLTSEFLDLSRLQPDEWSRNIVCRLLGCVEETNPSCWIITIRPELTIAIDEFIKNGGEVKLHHLLRVPGNRKKKLPCIALMLQRGSEKIMLPDENTILQSYDRILCAGDPRSSARTYDICRSQDLLHYMITGSHRPTGWLGNWLVKSRTAAKDRSKPLED